MKRREFSILAGLGLAGCATANLKMPQKQDYGLMQKLNKYTHLAQVQYPNGIQQIAGIVYDDFFLTVAHGMIGQMFGQIIKGKPFVHGKPLTEVHFDPDYDMALYSLPKGHGLKSYPLSMNDEGRELGDLLALSGNPLLRGPNYRFGRVTDLDGLSDMPVPPPLGFKGSIGTDINIVKGDSGTPILNLDKMVVDGLCSFEIDGAAYYRDITVWKKYMK